METMIATHKKKRGAYLALMWAWKAAKRAGNEEVAKKIQNKLAEIPKAEDFEALFTFKCEYCPARVEPSKTPFRGPVLCSECEQNVNHLKQYITQ